ncbi:MAG: polyphosphate polymerase domain-containing protein [Flavobacteriales bacterium]
MSDHAQQLARFEPISLQEMDSVKLQNRVDTKYVFAAALLPELLEAMLPHYRLLHVNGNAGSAYRSLYFDTADHRHFKDHHNKRTFRNKVRFREYIGSDLVFLEVKRKTGGGRTDKARIRVSDIPEVLSTDHVRFIQQATGRNEALQPALWNHFTRYTFVNRHAPERLTMDVGLIFSDPARKEHLGEIVVAELKQERADRSAPFVQLMRARGIRPAGMSKYCVGMLMLQRPVKHNAFKEVLRRLEALRRTRRTIEPVSPR